MTEMLEKAIEIEGLIRILKNGMPSPEIYNLIFKKADALAKWAQSQTGTVIRRESIPDSAIKEEIKDDVLMEFAEAEEHQTPAEDDITLSLDNDEPIKDCQENENRGKDADEEIKICVEKKQIPEPAEIKCLTNLKAYFSLNDRFLYSRELFDGSMKMFDSTLKYLEGVKDYATVEDYFYNEMDWDRENEHVKSFMEILKSKF